MEQNEIEAFDKIIGELELAVMYAKTPSVAFTFKNVLLQVKSLKMKFVAKERTGESKPEPKADKKTTKTIK
jgi:hypothetical protein